MWPQKSVAAGRINRIAARCGCRTYLEIGVCLGNTFFHVNIPHKTGVDPHFLFKISNIAPNLFLFQNNSNDFFNQMTEIRDQYYKQHIVYDLIYLDGMHTFEQTILDFINTLPYSHSKTIWIFDDTVPADPWSALPDQAKTQKYRSLAGSRSPVWHGDVYKCIFVLHDYFAEFSWCTPYDLGNGQTVVWKTATPTEREKVTAGLDTIKTMNYFDLLDRCQILNPVRDAEVLDLIGTNVTITAPDGDRYLKHLVRPCVLG